MLWVKKYLQFYAENFIYLNLCVTVYDSCIAKSCHQQNIDTLESIIKAVQDRPKIQYYIASLSDLQMKGIKCIFSPKSNVMHFQ